MPNLKPAVNRQPGFRKWTRGCNARGNLTPTFAITIFTSILRYVCVICGEYDVSLWLISKVGYASRSLLNSAMERYLALSGSSSDSLRSLLLEPQKLKPESKLEP